MSYHEMHWLMRHHDYTWDHFFRAAADCGVQSGSPINGDSASADFAFCYRRRANRPAHAAAKLDTIANGHDYTHAYRNTDTDFDTHAEHR
jgi:S-formylglutathione hydrolase FrmB